MEAQLFTRCSLLVVKSLVTRCRSCSLQKITRNSLSNSVAIRCRSCSLETLTCYTLQNCLLLFAEVAPCKKSLANRYEKTSETNVYLKPLKIVELYLFILYFQLTKTRGRFRVKYNYHRKIIMLVQVDYLQ